MPMGEQQRVTLRQRIEALLAEVDEISKELEQAQVMVNSSTEHGQRPALRLIKGGLIAVPAAFLARAIRNHAPATTAVASTAAAGLVTVGVLGTMGSGTTEQADATLGWPSISRPAELAALTETPYPTVTTPPVVPDAVTPLLPVYPPMPEEGALSLLIGPPGPPGPPPVDQDVPPWPPWPDIDPPVVDPPGPPPTVPPVDPPPITPPPSDPPPTTEPPPPPPPTEPPPLPAEDSDGRPWTEETAAAWCAANWPDAVEECLAGLLGGG